MTLVLPAKIVQRLAEFTIQSEYEKFMSPPTYRAILAVPASSPRFKEKAAQVPADSVFLDLEDAVISSLKPKGRQDAITVVNLLD